MSNNMTEKEFICIMCPLGCAVTVKADDKGDIKEVIGNSCKKGDAYAREEFTSPKRVLTSTVALEGAEIRRLPVRTTGLVPKAKLFDCMSEVLKISVKAPVKSGDLVIKDLLGLGVDVISTRDVTPGS